MLYNSIDQNYEYYIKIPDLYKSKTQSKTCRFLDWEKKNVILSPILSMSFQTSKPALHPERHSGKPSKIKTIGGIH